MRPLLIIILLFIQSLLYAQLPSQPHKCFVIGGGTLVDQAGGAASILIQKTFREGRIVMPGRFIYDIYQDYSFTRTVQFGFGVAAKENVDVVFYPFNHRHGYRLDETPISLTVFYRLPKVKYHQVEFSLNYFNKTVYPTVRVFAKTGCISRL